MRRLAALLAALAALALSPAAAASPPAFSAKAVLVANGATGEVLYEYEADRPLPMASLTKVMTALVTLERTRPDEMVTVTRRASTVGESTIYLQPGERLPVRDLLAAALIQSANDAAYALATYVGDGSVARFVALMNERARELGLRDTHYVRPDGLDVSGHYSSARDILKLARQAMRKPLFRQLVRRRGADIAGGRSLFGWNDLLGTYSGAIGVKTGHTADAGWSEVAAARRDGVTLYAVLLGGPTRAQRNADLAELLDWGFDQYGRVTLIRTGRTYATADVPFSDRKVRLVASEPAARTLRLGRPLVERVVAPAILKLPVVEGQRLGEVCVGAEEERVCRPLVAADAVSKPSLGRRMAWYAGRALSHAGGMLESVLGAIF